MVVVVTDFQGILNGLVSQWVTPLATTAAAALSQIIMVDTAAGIVATGIGGNK